jgi:hypothetical protein
MDAGIPPCAIAGIPMVTARMIRIPVLMRLRLLIIIKRF